MRFASLSPKVKVAGLVLLGFLLVGVFLLIGDKVDFSRRNDYLGKKDNISATVKRLRGQKDIVREYRENMTKLLATVAAADDYSAILAAAEAGFLDIYVPNDLREFHLRALLDIREASQPDTDPLWLKSIIQSKIEELLAKNNELELAINFIW